MVANTKVFVGSLPQGSKPEELRKLFERFGGVTECDIMNRCGFVHMETEEQAEAAIKALHSSTFNGGTITVERGRLKDRNQRGGMRGGRGGMRNNMDRRGGGPMRGGPMRRGPMGGRDGAPYMRDRPMRGSMGGGMRNGMGGGMDMRNSGMGMRNGMGGGGGYDRPIERAQLTMGGNGGGYDDRYGNYGVEDRRGFALMDGRGPARDPYAAPARDPYTAPARDPYAAPAADMYDDRRGGYGGAPIDTLGGSMGYPDRAPMYDDREMMDRRGAGQMRNQMPVNTGYDRAAPRAAPPMGNGDIYSRRTDMGAGAGMGGNMGAGYDRDPYAQQQYAPIGRWPGG